MKAYYKLIQDIDVSEWITDNNPQQGWMSIGSVNEPFTGTIDGGGFSVVNLMCNRPSTDHVGFIGYLKGTLTNISFVNPQIVGQQYVGIVGYLYEKHKEAKHPEQRVPKGQKTTEELDLVKEVLSEEKNKYKEDSVE